MVTPPLSFSLLIRNGDNSQVDMDSPSDFPISNALGHLGAHSTGGSNGNLKVLLCINVDL